MAPQVWHKVMGNPDFPLPIRTQTSPFSDKHPLNKTTPKAWAIRREAPDGFLSGFSLLDSKGPGPFGEVPAPINSWSSGGETAANAWKG